MISVAAMLAAVGTVVTPRAAVHLCAEPPAVSSPAAAGLPLPLSLLSGTNLDGRTLARCYKASCDGWSALDFHRQCDELGSVIVVGQLQSGELVGGYNPVGWESVDDYRATPRAFLFCSTDAPSDDGAPLSWQQCAALGPGEIAIFDNARGGPQFGAADFVVGAPLAPVMGGFAGPDTMDDSRTAGDLRAVRSTLGGSYATLPQGGSLPTGELTELEVYCNAELATRSDAWFPSRDDRASKAPELLITDLAKPRDKEKKTEQAGDKQVGWWPW